jgi:hypothetical protein
MGGTEMGKRILAALVAAVSLAMPAAAQTFPNKPIRLITLTTPGGSLDILARMMADDISKQMGQQVVVENRVGAGGNVGAEATVRADPDGYTIGMVTVSTHGINKALYGERMKWDPVKDSAPIILAAELKNVVVVHPSVPAQTVPELVAYAQANPDKISFGSAGTGTTQDDDWRENAARALSRCGCGGPRSAGRTHSAHVRQHSRCHRAYPSRHAAADRRHFQSTIPCIARRVAHGGTGL